MKKILYSLFLAIAAFGVSSCSKQDGGSVLEQPEEIPATLHVPSNFGRKILVEEFTGAWCGYCPRGTFYFDSMNTHYPGILVGVSIHVNNGGFEVMEVPELLDTAGHNILEDFFQLSGVPSGVVNRGVVDDPADWPSDIPPHIGVFAKCGFYIDATHLSGNNLSVTVHTGFSADMAGDYRLNVWVVETDIHNATDPAYDQTNYYSSASSSPDTTYPYYYMADPINDFHHENVLRKMLTSVPFGDQIPQDKMKQGKDYIKTFNVNLTGMVKANTYIVAFVDKYSPVPTTDNTQPQHQVQNVQKGLVGHVQGWN